MTDSDWYTFISHSPSFECYSRIISDDTVIEKYRVRQTGCLHYRAVLSNGELLSITYIPEDERSWMTYGTILCFNWIWPCWSRSWSRLIRRSWTACCRKSFWCSYNCRNKCRRCRRGLISSSTCGGATFLTINSHINCN